MQVPRVRRVRSVGSRSRPEQDLRGEGRGILTVGWLTPTTADVLMWLSGFCIGIALRGFIDSKLRRMT